MTEANIQRTCSDLLALEGWRLVRTDPVSDRRRGKGFGEKGMCDCLYLRYREFNGDQVLWIEWKGPRAKVEPHQHDWHVAERARGATVWVATETFGRSVDDFLAFYRTTPYWLGKI